MDKGVDDRMRKCPACGKFISIARVVCPSCKARVYSLLVEGGENHRSEERNATGEGHKDPARAAKEK